MITDIKSGPELSCISRAVIDTMQSIKLKYNLIFMYSLLMVRRYYKMSP